MFRTIRNVFFGILAAASIAAIVRTVVGLLTPEQREKLNARVQAAIESGKQAAAERRYQLENRLEELVGQGENDKLN
jgi:hypothetical protein